MDATANKESRLNMRCNAHAPAAPNAALPEALRQRLRLALDARWLIQKMRHKHGNTA